MKTIAIKVESGQIVVEPETVELGGEHHHKIDWKNKATDQATITIGTPEAGEIFMNPPPRGVVIVGSGGGEAPNPPLELKPHTERPTGTFDYRIAIGQMTATVHMHVHK